MSKSNISSKYNQTIDRCHVYPAKFFSSFKYIHPLFFMFGFLCMFGTVINVRTMYICYANFFSLIFFFIINVRGCFSGYITHTHRVVSFVLLLIDMMLWIFVVAIIYRFFIKYNLVCTTPYIGYMFLQHIYPYHI